MWGISAALELCGFVVSGQQHCSAQPERGANGQPQTKSVLIGFVIQVEVYVRLASLRSRVSERG
jgi:hypothetical protein